MGNFKEMFITKNEELEKHVLNMNPELEKNKCEICNVIKCMRSLHCQFCNRCISKYELHSDWFNTCVGSTNSFMYVLILITLVGYYAFSFIYLFFELFSVDKDYPTGYDENEFKLHTYTLFMFYLHVPHLCYKFHVSLLQILFS